jgi:hypothetical protein
MNRFDNLGKPRFAKAYGFAIVTTALFLLSWTGQFIAQVTVESNDAVEHGQPFQWNEFIPQFLSSTFENWQSEFLQLVWQSVGLMLLLCWGSSQSRETENRMEEKLDRLLEIQGINPAEVSKKVNESL